MAETIKVEIPVSVQDNTGSALSGITSKLNSLARASEKANKVMIGGTAKKTNMEKSVEKMNRALQKVFQVEITIKDNASPTISNIEDRANHLSGTSVELSATASDHASSVFGDVEGAVASADGGVANVEAYGEDVSAANTMSDVEGAVASTDGGVANVEAHGEDVNAQDTMSDVEGSVSATDGITATVTVYGEDVNAQDTIADVEAALSSLDGQGATVHIDAENGSGIGDSGGISTPNVSTPSLGSSAIPGLSSAGAGYAAAKGGLLGAAGFAGLSLGVGSAANTYQDFEYAMSEVKAISGAEGEKFDALVAAAENTGATTKFTATESADALKYMAMAGWNPDEMLGGLSGIVNLAAASGESIGRSSDIVTDALTAFGLGADESDRFANVLAKTSASANTNVSEMGEAFKYVGAAAGMMHYSIEDTAVAIGLMSNAGVHASQAGTALRRSILGLSKPSDQAKAAMDKYGISLTKGDGSAKSLMEVMTNLRESLGGLSEVEQANVIGTIFGQQASTGIAAIVNAKQEDWESLIEEVGKAQDGLGAATEMSNTMLDNMKGSITLLQSAFEGVQNTLGKRLSPYIREIADDLAAEMPNVSETINSLFDDLESAFDTGGLEGVGAEIGDIITSVTATIGEKAPEAITAGTEFLNGLLDSISNPENADQIGSAAASIVTAIGTSFPTVASEMGTAALSLITSFTQSLADQEAGTKIVEAFTNSMSNMGDWYEENGDSFSSAAGDLLDQIVSGIDTNSDKIGDAAASIVTGLGTAFLENAGKAGTAALNLIDSLVSGLTENDVGTKLVDAITTSITDVGNWFGENGGDFGEAAGVLISQLAEGISSNAGAILGAGIQIVSGLAQGLIRGIGVLIGNAPSIIMDLVGAILQNIPMLFQAGIELIGALKDGVISAAKGFGDFLNESLIIDPIDLKTDINYDDPGSALMEGVQETMTEIGSPYSNLTEGAREYFDSLASGETTVTALDEAIQGMEPGSEQFDNANQGLWAFIDTINALHEAGVGVDETGNAVEEAGESAQSGAEMVEDAMGRVQEAASTEGESGGFEGTINELDQLADSYTNVGEAADEALDVDLADSLGGLTGDIMNSLLSAEDIQARAEEINSALQTVATGLEPVASSIEIDLTQENNVDELVSEVQGEIDGAFSGGFSTSATVTITLDWQISNPTASINVSASGGTATATIAGAAVNAWGSYVDGPLLSWVGEEGPEYIIPVGADKQGRGLDLWAQAGAALGVPGFADGGIVGGIPTKTSGGSIPVETGQGGSGGPVSVSVGAPVFNINSDNPIDVMKVISENFDNLMETVADRLAEVYEATPVA